MLPPSVCGIVPESSYRREAEPALHSFHWDIIMCLEFCWLSSRVPIVVHC